MQNLCKLAEDRIRAESLDFELDLPNWLKHILDDELYYCILLITVCADSFTIGLCVGWLATL
jgi:hypothetical protein